MTTVDVSLSWVVSGGVASSTIIIVPTLPMAGIVAGGRGTWEAEEVGASVVVVIAGAATGAAAVVDGISVVDLSTHPLTVHHSFPFGARPAGRLPPILGGGWVVVSLLLSLLLPLLAPPLL